MQNKDAQHDKSELMGMMLPKETETEVQLKEYYAFINFQFYEEASRWIHATPKYLSNILMEMTKKENKVTTDVNRHIKLENDALGRPNG